MVSNGALHLYKEEFFTRSNKKELSRIKFPLRHLAMYKLFWSYSCKLFNAWTMFMKLVSKNDLNVFILYSFEISTCQSFKLNFAFHYKKFKAKVFPVPLTSLFPSQHFPNKSRQFETFIKSEFSAIGQVSIKTILCKYQNNCSLDRCKVKIKTYIFQVRKTNGRLELDLNF